MLLQQAEAKNPKLTLVQLLQEQQVAVVMVQHPVALLQVALLQEVLHRAVALMVLLQVVQHREVLLEAAHMDLQPVVQLQVRTAPQQAELQQVARAEAMELLAVVPQVLMVQQLVALLRAPETQLMV